MAKGAPQHRILKSTGYSPSGGFEDALTPMYHTILIMLNPTFHTCPFMDTHSPARARYVQGCSLVLMRCRDIDHPFLFLHTYCRAPAGPRRERCVDVRSCRPQTQTQLDAASAPSAGSTPRSPYQLSREERSFLRSPALTPRGSERIQRQPESSPAEDRPDGVYMCVCMHAVRCKNVCV